MVAVVDIENFVAVPALVVVRWCTAEVVLGGGTVGVVLVVGIVVVVQCTVQVALRIGDAFGEDTGGDFHGVVIVAVVGHLNDVVVVRK